MSTKLHGKEMKGLGPIGARTNIDRRNSKREVPMKVLCLGLGRTGTASMRAALIQLGFVDCYHMVSVVEENPKDADMWVEAFEAKFEGKGEPWGRAEFDKVLGHCMAVTDWPCASFVDELITAYPEAKVVLTVRDNVEVWHKSVTETLWTGDFIFGAPKSVFQAAIQKIIPKPDGYLMPKTVYKYTPLGNHPEGGRDAYLKHNEHVRDIAPKGKFLEFNVKEGWKPLCDFLEVEVPDGPFPRVNDTEAWKAHVEKSKKDAALKLLSSAVMIIGSAGALALAYWSGFAR